MGFMEVPVAISIVFLFFILFFSIKWSIEWSWKVRRIFFNLIDNDHELKSVFGRQEDTLKNPLVDNLRDELLSELLQLVESVLLGKLNSTSDQNELLKKRLAQVLEPANDV